MEVPNTIVIPGMRSGYKTVVDHVIRFGRYASPSDKPTKEVVAPTVVMTDPTDSYPIGAGRGVKSAIAAVEAAQLVAGAAAPEMVRRSSRNFGRYAEADGTFWGAYGDRIGRQFEAVAGKLLSDEHSRRAVITLWDPSRDNQPGKRDYPCTIVLQFLVRDDRLKMITTMRSNDVWLGLAYDVFQFTQLQLSLGNAIDVQPGEYIHQAGSLHIYDEHIGPASGLVHSTEAHPPTSDGFGRLTDDAVTVRNRARAILYGDVVDDMTPTEEWYRRTLEPLRS